MTKKTKEIKKESNFNIGEMLTVQTTSIRKKKYCTGYVVVENSQPDKLALFNVFTNDLEFIKISDKVSRNENIDKPSNPDKLKSFDIVVFKDTISKKRMKIFFVNKIHKNNTCDLVHINSLNLEDDSISFTLKNVNLNLLMHIEHAFRITHKTVYDNKTYTFQDYKFSLANNIEKNIIVGTLEKEGHSEDGSKNNNIICYGVNNSDKNKERVLINRCFTYLNDNSIIFKASSDHIRMIFTELCPNE